MFILRFLLEQLLKTMFAAARSGFIAQVVATAAATFTIFPFLNRPDSPDWLPPVLNKVALIAIISLVAAIALIVVRWKTWRAPDALDELDAMEEHEPDSVTLEDLRRQSGPQEAEPYLSPWIVPLLGFSLAALPAYTYVRSAELIALWTEVFRLADQLNLKEELLHGGAQMSGLLFAPIFVVLYVPMIEAAAAFFLIAVPLLLLALFLTRSRNFPRAFVMMAICQAGLVFASAIGASLFDLLADEVLPVLSASGGPEGEQAVDVLIRMQHVVQWTATGFFVPLAAFWAWVPGMFTSRRIKTFFIAGARPPSDPQPEPGV
jgi:hypothetical protein